ncbi:hypothetical protein GBA52_005253 [Prunus armeniaca]|nr:hypothetical protein GBA52_005253 [Prunus armeniaca]
MPCLPLRPRRLVGDRNPRLHGLLHRRHPHLQVCCLLRRLALPRLLQLLPTCHFHLLTPCSPCRLPLCRDKFPHWRLGLTLV